jgi:predicted MFS family arabinose efflux permease
MTDPNNSEQVKPDSGVDKHYIGNMWGWKFSFFGLFLILALAILMVVRYTQLPPEKRVWNPEVPESQHPFHKKDE